MENNATVSPKKREANSKTLTTPLIILNSVRLQMSNSTDEF